MESLFDALYAYAMTKRFDTYSLRDTEERQENEKMVRNAMEELKIRGMGDAAQRIEDGFTILAYLDRHSAFWAGLSIGMELHRL